ERVAPTSSVNDKASLGSHVPASRLPIDWLAGVVAVGTVVPTTSSSPTESAYATAPPPTRAIAISELRIRPQLRASQWSCLRSRRSTGPSAAGVAAVVLEVAPVLPQILAVLLDVALVLAQLALVGLDLALVGLDLAAVGADLLAIRFDLA